MNYYDIAIAANQRLVANWPEWPVYMDVCPEQFQRPSFWLHDFKASQAVLTPFLVQRKLSGVLTVNDETDDHYDVSSERLMQVLAEVMDLLTPPLKVGDRRLTLEIQLEGRDPGEGHLILSAQWMDDDPAGTDEPEAPVMEHFDFAFDIKNDKE